MAGSPCPVEVMKACVDRMHMTEVTICYGMTETSPVSTQTLPDDSLHHRTATVGRAHPHVEIRIADPTTGATLERGETGEFCTRGYSVMPGYWNDDDAHGRGHRRRRVDAHRRPRRDGRGRVREHRRAQQGHGHPRRRERVPARGRGVPVHAPRRRGRAGDRRARRALRRGADGVGQAAARGRRRRGGAARVLPGQDRPLQGPALRQVRRRVPDDRHRQGAEVQDARAIDRRARPRPTSPPARWRDAATDPCGPHGASQEPVRLARSDPRGPSESADARTRRRRGAPRPGRPAPPQPPGRPQRPQRRAGPGGDRRRRRQPGRRRASSSPAPTRRSAPASTCATSACRR